MGVSTAEAVGRSSVTSSRFWTQGQGTRGRGGVRGRASGCQKRVTRSAVPASWLTLTAGERRGGLVGDQWWWCSASGGEACYTEFSGAFLGGGDGRL